MSTAVAVALKNGILQRVRGEINRVHLRHRAVDGSCNEKRFENDGVAAIVFERNPA
mgnify:CR=1 FL=1